MLTEQLLVAGLVGFSSAAIGVVVGQAVNREKVSTIGKAVDGHADNFKRTIWRDECAGHRATCEKHNDEWRGAYEKRNDEWRAEMIKRMDRLEGALRSCFDDLVKELRR